MKTVRSEEHSGLLHILQDPFPGSDRLHSICPNADLRHSGYCNDFSVPVSGGSTAQIGGASIADLGPVLAEQVGLPPAARGIVVTDVDPSSPAGVAGLLPGDVILGINNTSVQTVTELQDAVWRMALTPVVLYVGRGGAVYSFTVATR